MKDKGFALTVDAVLAMSFILTIAIALSAQRYGNVSESTELAFVSLHYISEDALDILNKQGILDQIGEYWTSDNTTAANGLATEYLDLIVPQNVGYKLWIYNNTSTTGYTTLAENDRVSEDDAIAETYSLRFLVGYKKGAPILASVSRAFLTGITSKTSSAYAYFGGFEGQGNLTKYLEVPDGVSITEAYMEMDAGSPFDLYVNGGDCGTYTPSGDYLAADVQEDISACSFQTGQNTIELRFTSDDGLTSQYIGGGFIRVTYNTTEMAESELTGSGRHEFPGIDGLVNYYGSFYVPGTLESMTAHLVFQNNYTTFFSVGDTMVYSSTGSESEQTVDLTNPFLQAKLNYNNLGETTIPLRLGTSNISSVIQEGNADVVLVTDLSLSMGYRVDNDSYTGVVTRSCVDPLLYDGSTRRSSLAKCLDEQFVDIILNNSGNNVALVGFSDDASNDAYNHNFTSNRASLISTIDGYPDDGIGYTCICCAINKAYEMLASQETLVEDGETWKYTSYTGSSMELISSGDDSWKYTSYSSCGASCNPASSSTPIPGSCTPSPGDWTSASFNDASWAAASLPKENSNEASSVFYYRRHFNLSESGFTSATLYLRNRRGVQCYLNGYSLGTDTSCEDGNYWDNTWSVSADYFNDPGEDNVLACRVRSSSSSNKGIEFDAELVINNPCGSSCDPTSVPGICTPTDWYEESFDDDAWGDADLPKENADEENSVFYYRKHFTLDADATGSGLLSLSNRRGVQCYLNGNIIGTDTSCSSGDYWDNEWTFPASYFNGAGEDNVLACRVRSSSGFSYRGIAFDAQLTTASDRNKFIVVMSDGVANYRCDDDCEGTSTSGELQPGCMLQCTGDACDCPINNAIWSAERVHTNLSTTLHSVGFGPVTECENGEYALQQIADVGNGSYCASTNATQLQECYVQFANFILEASIRSQIVNITGSATVSTLSPESYLEYTYTPNVPELEYGEITLTYDTERFNDNVTCTGSFYIPEDVSVIDAKATSYSSEHWTDYLEVNSIEGYELADYGGDYFDYGDPFVVYMDPANIVPGQSNNVLIGTGDSPSNDTGCSEDNRAILTIKMSGSVGYGDVYTLAEGCNWDIDFEDGSSVQMPIPSSYTGSASCTYKSGNINVTEDDALNDAVYRVLQKLDLDDNGKLDILFDPNQVELDSSRVGGVRSLYGPVQFKLVLWV